MSEALGQKLSEDMREPDFRAYAERLFPYTLTFVERLYALYQAVKYVSKAGIPGDMVECGVWRGGSVMMMAETLALLGDTERKIHLFDTFEGMTPPTSLDVDLYGNTAANMMSRGPRETNEFWAYASLEDVQANMLRTAYPFENFVFVKGDVAETLPSQAPERIALLRLDTDWYESTRRELETLFPRLSPNGVLIIDDYGHFEGARKAVDDYFATLDRPYLMNRVDYTGRLIIKTA